MRFIHRVSISSSSQIQRELATFGVQVASTGFVTFQLDEEYGDWPEVASWIARRRAVDVVTTEFTDSEVAAAEWAALKPDWHCGYPQPRERDFGYRSATYDLARYCDRCGVGLKQNAPFQMKGEPRWGRRSILQLFWIYDEFFVTPDIWETVFKPHGVESRPVLNTKGNELKTVLQLVVAEDVAIETDGLLRDETACSKCGQTKYLPITRGSFAPLVNRPSNAMAKTAVYFGSGASANKAILVSKALGRDLRAAQVRGASLWPAAQTSQGPLPQAARRST